MTLCTTFWDVTDPETGSRREKELCGVDFWGKMTRRGSKVARLYDYRKSRDLLWQTFGKSSKVTLEIQKEMVDENMPLDETAVGKTMITKLAQIRTEHEEHLARIREEHREALQQRDDENKRQHQELSKKNNMMRKSLANLAGQQKEQQRLLKARLDEANERAQKLQEEKERLEKIQKETEKKAQIEKKRLEERYKLKAEQKQRDELNRKLVCRQYRTEFASQIKALDTARAQRLVSANILDLYRQQSPTFLRWCDRCFHLIGFKGFWSCEPCSLYLCEDCWKRGRRCKTESHVPQYRKEIAPPACCHRLKGHHPVVNCDRCSQPCFGLHFHCCDCEMDDMDICLRCVTNRGTCKNPRAHWLHPIVVWPV